MAISKLTKGEALVHLTFYLKKSANDPKAQVLSSRPKSRMLEKLE